jgi:hypothetical protein
MIISTKTSVYFIESDGSEQYPKLLLDGVDVRRIVEGEKRIVIALTDGNIILLGDEEKRINSGIKDRIDSLCFVNENPLDLLMGTTPPYLYRASEEETAKRIETFDKLKVREQWYTPWGGPPAVRSLASTKDGWIYADIHVGSIMRSPDQGRTWEPVTPTLHRDVHEVNTTPASNSRIFANTFLSVYISDDRGETWEHRSKDLNDRYGRGIAVNPEDPEIILCGVSDGPRGVNVHGQLYHTQDAGCNWIHVTNGFPESTRKNIDTFHITYATKDVAWATDEENLFLSRDGGQTWEKKWKAPDEIMMISCHN